MAKKHKVIECRDSNEETRLNVIIRVLESIEQQQQCMEGSERIKMCERKCIAGSERIKMCERIVSNLGTIAMPSTTEEYKTIMSQVTRIQEVLTKALAGDEEMIVSTLRAFYTEISNTQKQPKPTMSIVLEIIDKQYFPIAVKNILHSGYPDSSLEQALSTLCSWLSKWTWTPQLGPLVLEFMRGLESEGHYDILIVVTLTYVDHLFKLLILPEVRKSLEPVVFHMLYAMQHSPKAFHKIITDVANVLQSLYRENSESSQICLQKIVNLCVALMDHFPGYPIYDQLRQTLAPFNPAVDYKQSLNCKSWLDRSSILVQSQYTPGKVGLNNLGNTCYMNSVLQALFMTKQFRNDILLSNRDAMPLFSKLQVLFALLQFSERSSLSPSDISTIARPPGFQVGHQHDSSEFLGYLLDVLHEQEGSIYNSSIGDAASNANSICNVPTTVKKSFGGRTLTLSKCSCCHSRSERVDTFRDLQLSFPSTIDNQSVQTLIEYYLQTEKLCGDNQYYCDACGELTDGERVTKILEPPLSLVLTLKHFRYDPVTQLRTKILQQVKLDNNIILHNTQYNLYAAVVHCGSSVDSGHYYTYAKDGMEWYKFNDCYVIKSREEELCGLRPPEAPYILFYSRMDCDEPEAVNKSELSLRLQNILYRDSGELDAEKKKSNLNLNSNRQNKNDDPPPPGCGGSGFMNSQHNPYVC